MCLLGTPRNQHKVKSTRTDLLQTWFHCVENPAETVQCKLGLARLTLVRSLLFGIRRYYYRVEKYKRKFHIHHIYKILITEYKIV